MPKPLRKSSSWNAEILRRFSADQRYLVGVSGGRDSVALLHWLASQGYRRLIVCHLDHRLRGRSAAADARFVKRLADDLPDFVRWSERDVRMLAKDSEAIDRNDRALGEVRLFCGGGASAALRHNVSRASRGRSR